MKENSNIILTQFDESKYLYQGLADSTSTLLNSLILEKLKPHQIQFRVKDRDSLTKKLIRKNNKYSSIKEITDIIGFRVVTYFEDDIDLIERIIKSEFEIDNENSIDKRDVEVDKFGYRSVHYVVSLNKDRLKLTEYKKYKGLKFEIQIRSILQHSWAEIEHDIGYKGESEIPNTAKRTFYRVAALLEQADIEFTKLRAEIKDYENIIDEELTKDNSKIQINKSSLIGFIKSSSELEILEREMENEFNCECSNEIDNELIGSQQLIKDLAELNINYINELENSLIKNRDKVIEGQKEFIESLTKRRKNSDTVSFIKGAPIIWLRNYLKDELEHKK